MCTKHWSIQIYKENLVGHQEDIDSNTIIIGEFNATLLTMDRYSKKGINKDIGTFNDTIDQRDL